MATLGIDLGGTFARAAVVDAQGRIVASAKTALSDRRPEAVVESIGEAVEETLALAKGEPLTACGVGVAGQLGPGGVVLVGPNLGWRVVPFGAMLSARLGRSVQLVNDLSAAGWGELKAGAGQGVRDLWVVFVGSGVGSAIIAAGRLIRGAHHLAGEFGHIKVVVGGRPCGCGERGCLEAYVGGHNLMAQMKEAVASGAGTSLRRAPADQLTPALLEEAAESNDAVARRIYDAAVQHLSLAVANQVTLLNPARVILGGGALSRMPGMKAKVREAIFTQASATARAKVTVADAALGDDSGLIGAALLATEDEPL